MPSCKNKPQIIPEHGKTLFKIYTQLEQKLIDIGFAPGKSGRHMKFPYTISAKMAQFPICHYLKYTETWTYYPVAIMISAYLISYIHVAVNSKENVEKWAEIKRKEAQEHHH